MLEMLSLKINPDERNELKCKAKEMGVSMSMLMREGAMLLAQLPMSDWKWLTSMATISGVSNGEMLHRIISQKIDIMQNIGQNKS